MHHNIQAYQQSIALLRQASSPDGFVAAVQPHDNYQRVWTRDGVVCSLAALLSEDRDLIATAAATIQTIFQHQHADGFMPSNIDMATGKVSYGGIVGRADNPCWAVIGLCQYTLLTQDLSLSKQYLPSVEHCFRLLTAWEFNGRHLLYVPQSGDWADEYIQHGYILFEQLLRIWALELAGEVYGRSEWIGKAAKIRKVILDNYWPSDKDHAYSANLYSKQRHAFRGYWLMGFNPSRVYPYFDLQANSLAILLKLGDEEKMERQVTTYMKQLLAEYHSNMLPSFYPAILDTDEDMKELRNNFAYQFRNKPHQFHNGGLWPVWNGLAVQALQSAGEFEVARKLTAGIHAGNQQEGDSFNECLDGSTAAPCGVAYCAWSAAGAVLAEKALEGKKLINLFL